MYVKKFTSFCQVLKRCTQKKIGSFFCLTTVPSVLWRCWLGGRKRIRPEKNWVLGCWCGYLPGAMCRLAYGPADDTATHCLLLQWNPDWFYLSGTGCVCVCFSASQCRARPMTVPCSCAGACIPVTVVRWNGEPASVSSWCAWFGTPGPLGGRSETARHCRWCCPDRGTGRTAGSPARRWSSTHPVIYQPTCTHASCMHPTPDGDSSTPTTDRRSLLSFVAVFALVSVLQI